MDTAVIPTSLPLPVTSEKRDIGAKESKVVTQLNPPLPLETPKGKGWAYFLIDYSQDHDLLWVVFLDESRECWTFQNSNVRIDKNYSLGRN